MKKKVIMDTGPLVAFLNKRDKYHLWAKEHFGVIEPPLLTCEPVMSEACFLVSNIKCGQESIIDLLTKGLIVIAFSLKEEIISIKKLISKYSNIPMSLADACLVRMSELYLQSKILTLDSDFCFYRKSSRHVIPLIIPTTF